MMVDRSELSRQAILQKVPINPIKSRRYKSLFSFVGRTIQDKTKVMSRVSLVMDNQLETTNTIEHSMQVAV